MSNKSLTHFVLRTMLAALPVLLFIVTYIVLDPFRVIHRYNDLSENDSIRLGCNAAFVSITSLERNLAAGRHYDSFIFGSSMSQAFKAQYWQPHLAHDASIFHLDASEETIQGIVDKIHYLHKHHIKIKNALIVMEELSLHRTPNDHNFLFTRVPSTTSDVTWLQFQLQFFNIFKHPDFVCYSIYPSKWQDKMLTKHYITRNITTHIDSINENIYAGIDSIIAIDPDLYYTPEQMKLNSFLILPDAHSPGINATIEHSLQELAQLLKNDGTDYHFIIPPRYNRDPLTSWDLATLQLHLGVNRVHDMTQHPLSKNSHSYYDSAGHLISARCKTILDDALAINIHYQSESSH